MTNKIFRNKFRMAVNFKDFNFEKEIFNPILLSQRMRIECLEKGCHTK